MNYAQMMMSLIGMNEFQRRQALQSQWSTVFTDDFVNYVQNQVQQIDDYVSGEQRGLSQIFPEVVQKFMVGANEIYKAQIIAVWESMEAVYAQGPVTYEAVESASNASQSDYSDIDISSCSRCGTSMHGYGLCTGCTDHDAFIEQDHIEYDRQLYEQQLEQQNYQHVQNDYVYYDTQMDYGNEY